VGDVYDPTDRSVELNFETAEPYDLIPRVFDHARKSGIRLVQLSVSPRSSGIHCVAAVFTAPNVALLDTLRKRCALIQSGWADDGP